MEPRAPTPTGPVAPTSLWSGLAEGAGEIERTLARMDQGIAGVGVLVGVYATLFLSRSLGGTLGLLALASFAWFTLAHAMLVRERGIRWLRWLLPLSEIGIPGLVLWISAEVQGPIYALGSWVPPMLFSLFIAVQALRLRPVLPLVVSGVAAVQYWIFVAVALRGGLPDDLLFRPVTQATRVFSLILTGGAVTLATMALRHLIDRASADLRAHDLFGKYRIGRTIAMGGMGRVVQALYCPEGGFVRKVAIKLIHPHLAHDPAFLARFRREAALAARLNHPNIVGALDFGVVDGLTFFAMEFVDGPTLRDLLEQRRQADHPLPTHLALYVGREIAQGLHYAHAGALDDFGDPLRVVHRDLSPSNVLVARSGQVKISDFGVARALGDTHSIHTETIAGKPSYLAPEQLREGKVDERSDLFALGVILWEMCANRRLFLRQGEMATMYAVLEDAVPRLSDVRPELGHHWDAFFERALSKEPTERYQTALELLAALAMMEDHEGGARPEDLAAVVRAWLDAPELAIDPATPAPSGSRSPPPT